MTTKQTLLERLRHAIQQATPSSAGSLRLHVLFSTPKAARELYPFAHVASSPSSETIAANALDATEELIFCTVSWADEDEAEQPVTEQSQGSATTTKSTRRLVLALECFLYTLPWQKAALLYVSKIDSSGWAPPSVPAHLRPFLDSAEAAAAKPVSLTRSLVTAFLSHFASLAHWSGQEGPAKVQHCAIHVLARAQPTYLFPSSPENARKHVLNDALLIRWWRSVLSDTVKQARKEGKVKDFNYYLVPGYDEAMSASLLPLSASTDQVAWTYGHPYTRTSSNAPPLPLYRANTQHPNLNYGTAQHGAIATLMPHFPDDPKSRFIAEIARDAHELRASSQLHSHSQDQSQDGQSQSFDKRRRLEDGTSAHVADPQSQSATLSVPSSSNSASQSEPPRSTPTLRKLQRERAALDDVDPNEFWERMGFRQECCAGNAVGVFVCLFEVASDTLLPLDYSHAASSTAASQGQQVHEAAVTPSPSPSASATKLVAAQPMSLPQSILPDLIRRHLMRDACIWSEASSAAELTRLWDDGVRTAILRKGSVGAQVDKHSETLGEGTVWCDVAWRGPSKQEREKAEKEWVEKGKPMPAKQEEKPKVVNSLSVKRKKKPA